MRRYYLGLICVLILSSCNSNKETTSLAAYKNDYYSFRYSSDWVINESKPSQYTSGALPPYLSLTNPFPIEQIEPRPIIYRFTGGLIEICVEYRRPWETVQSLTQRLPVSLQKSDVLNQQEETKLGFPGMNYTSSSKGAHNEDISSQGYWFIREVSENPITRALAFDIRLSIFNPQDIDENTKNGYINTYNEILESFKFLK